MNKSKLIKDWIIPIAIIFIVFILIERFIFFTASVRSISMLPTLQAKDKLIVTRIFNKDKLKTGDIVVFNGGDGHEHMHIKRIIGIPGDKLDLKENGKVYVNGKLLNEYYLNNQVVQTDHEHTDKCGHSEKTLNQPKINLGKFEVPEGKVFFLGDNRLASFDSRYWEDPYIDIDNIVGKTMFRVLPFNRFGDI